MNRLELVRQIKEKKNYLCVGLDTDITKIPQHLRSHSNAVFEFNKAIIDSTKDYCVSYKINTAFYESMGIRGWEALEQTVNYIPATHFKIADAKRGDIGNTSAQYAKTFFEAYRFDAVTVAPYMGEDSLRPFLEYKDKWTIVLGLTSNKGAADFEQLTISTANNQKQFLYEKVMQKVSEWGTPDNLMFVVGATKPEQLEEIRKTYPAHFFLVPGVGAQGGSLKEVSAAGLNDDGGILVNASRAIIYASSNENFAEEAKLVAKEYAGEMKEYIS
ncbi:orotidine-5'-phosphate decarboxylase [Segetibacter koreensis]|uniref:orotidine-5'-phosphate decarboxylase n=1 Tax=Segetibacter koreensis TaxID=398037 RepID=UPI00036138E9|nr:orotidine-5'-phosphate decarboxylase [Segetibacter koreensis]